MYEFIHSFCFPNWEISNISSWFGESKLLLNRFKTQVVTFKSHSKNVILHGIVLLEYKDVIFLGVDTDRGLKVDYHIMEIVGKNCHK